MTPGKRVSIEHLRERLNIARIKGCSKNPGGYLGAITIIFPVIGIIMIVGGYRDIRRKLKLLEAGLVANGLVVTYWSMPIPRRWNKPWYIGFSFCDGDDKRTETITVKERRLARFPKDKRVHVFYNPSRRKQVFVLESLL